VTTQTNTWEGRIAHVQVFNRLLSAAEMEACLKDPGSVRHSLRLWLPMTSAADVNDRSGNSFNAVATALETANGPPYNTRWVFGATDEVIGQIAIPSNGDEPAPAVQGLGTRTKLTASSSLMDGARLITTKGYGFFPSTVVEPTARDLYLFGNQNVPDQPWDNETVQNPVCHAIDLDGDAPTVSGCKIFDFRGDAISVKNNTLEFSRMIRLPRVINNKISHCWNGIVAGAVDTQIDGNRVASVRYIGIRATAGSIQCSNNHVFGAQTAISFEGGPSRSIGDRFSDADYGFKILSNAAGSHIADGTSEHCTLKSILADADRVRIHNTRILVANTSTQHQGENNTGITSIVGIHLANAATQSLVSDCDVEVGAYTFPGDTGLTGSTGVLVETNNVIIDNLKVIGSARDDEIGVRITAGPDPTGRLGGDFIIDARGGGFDESDDCVVKFDTPGMGQHHPTGQVWHILYAAEDIPVRLASGWGSTRNIFIRKNTEDEWTELTTGQAYP
jgi:hypothetical protein